MRLKTIVSGILASLGCYFALMRIAYDTLPAQILSEWPAPLWEGLISEEWINIAVFGFAALSLLLGGWISASWNKAQNWKESLRFGASAGLIAGALSFNFVGAAWAGLLAQKEVLKHASITLTETEGMQILFSATSETILQNYGAIWLYIIPSIILGALGGLIFAIEITPEEKAAPPRRSGWLFRLPAYTLTISGIASFVIMQAVLVLLPEILADTAADYNIIPTMPPHLLISFATLSIAPFFGIPFLLTFIWTLRRWKDHKTSFLFLGWIFLILTYIYFFNFKWFSEIFSTGLENANVVMLSSIAGTFLLIWFLTSEPTQDNYTFSFADWMGYILTQGILGGTQLFASCATFALSLVLITVENMPHLISEPSETVPTLPVEQIQTLFSMQQKFALLSIGAMIAIAIILSGITAFLRLITGMNRRQIDKDVF